MQFYILSFISKKMLELPELMEKRVTGMTFFYRENQLLATATELVRDRPEVTRVATVGCSTGQEVYSLLREFEKNAARPDVTVDGFDVVPYRIKRARQGSYSLYPYRGEGNEKRRTEVLENFDLDPNSNRIIIPTELKRRASFRIHDILRDPLPEIYPFIICSHLIQHYDIFPQIRIMVNLLNSLTDDGYLLMDGISVDHDVPFLSGDQLALCPELAASTTDTTEELFSAGVFRKSTS